MKPTTVMLVDDHAVVRVGFRLLLQAAEDLQVVAEADSGEQACTRYTEARPDIVVMDLAMAGPAASRPSSASSLVTRGHESWHCPRMTTPAIPKRALKAGALGYLSKRSAPETLIEAIRIVAARRMYIDASIAQTHGGAGRHRRAQSHRTALTARIPGVRAAGARRVGQSDRRDAAPEPQHHRHASVQHQAEAGGLGIRPN